MKQLQIEIKERKLDSNGYILIFIDKEWKSEHIYAVEQFIGRKLKKGEVVHHDDFNKQNNNLWNLTLFPNRSKHNHYHRQFKQFKNTQPRKTEILKLKEAMRIERIKNKLI